MNTDRIRKEQLLNLLCGISEPELMNTVLEAIFTPKELEDVNNRLLIFQMLSEKITQRKIAAELSVGIATVSRGALAYRNCRVDLSNYFKPKLS